MRYGRKSCIVCLIAALSCGSASAQTKAELEKTLHELESSKEQQKEVAAKQKRNAEELASLKRQNMDMADDIRVVEKRIAEKETALDIVEDELTGKEARLTERQDEIATLLYAMIRMQRLPRQFVAASPGDAETLLRTASALKLTYGATDQAVIQLAGDMEQLALLKKDTLAIRESLNDEKKLLSDKMAKLKDAMQERQTLQRDLDSNQDKLQKHIAALSKESSSLHELIQKLDREDKMFKALGVPQAKPEAPSRPGQESFAEKKGKIPFPASGKLIHRYGERKGPGENYSGHVVRTSSGAMVSAPHAGRVVFVGNFMDYGKMVILQHDKDYHTVLAGLDIIRTEAGQELQMGEPVGVMGNANSQRDLYLEVRKNSKAIDPEAWMSHLAEKVTMR